MKPRSTAPIFIVPFFIVPFFIAPFFIAMTFSLTFGAAIAADTPTPAAQGDKPVKVQMQTSKGGITLELDSQHAPKTVENFLGYVKSGHYDGTIFHRVIPGFMIQGGGFAPDMRQKPAGSPIRNEADNGLKNVDGSIAMARTSDPHSATAQFFINVKDNGFLNYQSATPQGYGYTVFGKVTDGMDVVRAIEQVDTSSRAGHQDVPTEPVVIEKVTVAE